MLVKDASDSAECKKSLADSTHIVEGNKQHKSTLDYTSNAETVKHNEPFPSTIANPNTEEATKEATANLPSHRGKSYAQAASKHKSYAKPPDVLATGLSAIPTVKQGTFVSFNIPDSIYKEQLHSFRFAIIGRLMLKKGDEPRRTLELQEEINGILKPSEPWSLLISEKDTTR